MDHTADAEARVDVTMQVCGHVAAKLRNKMPVRVRKAVL